MPGATETEFFDRAGLEDTKVGHARKDNPRDVAKTGFRAMMNGKGDVVTDRKKKLKSVIANVTPSAILASRTRKQYQPGSADCLLDSSKDDKDEELDKAAQILVLNDTLYQFTEWMHNYASYRVSSLRLILYDDPQSYIEECKIHEDAKKSHILASSICQCHPDGSSKQVTKDVTQLAETLKNTGIIVKLFTGELKLPEKPGSTEKGEVKSTESIPDCIGDDLKIVLEIQ